MAKIIFVFLVVPHSPTLNSITPPLNHDTLRARPLAVPSGSPLARLPSEAELLRRIVGYAAEYPIPVFFNVCNGFMERQNSSIRSTGIIPFFTFSISQSAPVDMHWPSHPAPLRNEEHFPAQQISATPSTPIHTLPMCGYDVQEYPTVRRHVEKWVSGGVGSG